MQDRPHEIILQLSTPQLEEAHERIFGKRKPAYEKTVEEKEQDNG